MTDRVSCVITKERALVLQSKDRNCEAKQGKGITKQRDGGTETEATVLEAQTMQQAAEI